MPECAEICLNGFCFTFAYCSSLSPRTIEGAGGCEPYPTIEIPDKYKYNAFFTFWYFRGVNQEFAKAVILQICKILTENSRQCK